jgi:two-component system nitrogen regulation response regulator NtrX
MNKKKVLIIDDEIDIADNIKAILEDEGYEATISHDSSDAFNQISNNVFSLIILDVWLDNSELDGIGILKKLREVDSTPVIVISGHGNIDMAVKAIKDGANEFIEKPFTTERLLLSVNRSIELHEIKSENNRLKQKDIYDYEFIGKSTAINKVKNLIKKISPTTSRVMIYGDSGTGKDIVAREIHKYSNFSNGPFIAINAALMEPENIEKEFFGYQENNISKTGYFEAASNGTIFIDEVAEMPLQTQAKILRVLTDKKFTKLGDNRTIDLNCRIICSSIQNLENLIDEGSFRKDLFHRLNVVSITLPKLTERLEDIDDLIRYFIRTFTGENINNENLIPIIKSKYINYDWPGNIRELRNIIERHIILGEKYDEENNLNENSDFTDQNVISLPLKNARKIFEKHYLQSQINRFDGNISKTAIFIGMERSALHRKLKQLGITEDIKK